MLYLPLGAAAAVIASAVVYALYHLDVTPLPLSMKIAFGVIHALVTLRTGSLIPATTAHTLLWTIVADN